MSDMPKLVSMLRPQDRKIIDDVAEVNWVPKDPKELLLPYVDYSDKSNLDRSSLEFRRQKAKEVYDGYGKIIEECKEMEAEIESQCKNVIVTLNPATHLRIMESVRRVFGTDGAQITFEMYKQCVQKLGDFSKQGIPDLNKGV
jgi:hypothetical protein